MIQEVIGLGLNGTLGGLSPSLTAKDVSGKTCLKIAPFADRLRNTDCTTLVEPRTVQSVCSKVWNRFDASVFSYCNKYMGKVDQLNALVAAYTSWRARNRSWMPLLHWHLNGNLGNAFKLCEPIGTPYEHQRFLEGVIVQLLNEGDSCRQLPPASITTQPKRLRGNHQRQNLKSVWVIIVCRRDNQKRVFGREINSYRKAAPRTRAGYFMCQAYLGRNRNSMMRCHGKGDDFHCVE